MSFWGLSDTGKIDRGRIPEIGNWNFAQYQNWIKNSGDFQQNANKWQDWATNYYGDLANGGGPQPWQNRQTGQEIMPGVDEALTNRWSRLGNIYSDWGNLPKADDTYGDISGWTDALGGNATGNYNDVEGDINDTFGRAMNRNSGTSNGIMGNVGDVYSGILDSLNRDYGGMRGNTAATYGGLQDLSGGTYNDLLKSGGNTYGTALDTLRALQPGGELQQARVARSYAPAKAAAASRLRMAGVDPNSPQAAQIMAQADRDTARGMDEAAANSTEGYVDRANQLQLSKQAMVERLKQAGLSDQEALRVANLNTGNQLLQTQNELGANYGREQGGLSRAEMLRNLNASNALDLERHGETVGNLNRASDRTDRYLNQRMQNALLNRNMQRQDFNTNADLLREQNQEELLGPQMRYQQYQAGFNQNAYNQQLRDQAAAKLLGISDADYQRMFGSAGIARGFGQDATENYLKSLGIESANAGWGTKMLIAIAKALATGGMGGGFGGGGMDIPMDTTISGGL